MARGARLVWWLVPAVLVAAAAYQLALALGTPSVGAEPGADPPGQWLVVWIAFLAMLLGAAAAGIAFLSSVPRAVATYAPAAAAVLVTRFYDYDPYYAPSLRRFSEGGNVAAVWVFALAVAAVFVGVIAVRVPRTGAAATVFALPILGFATVGVGIGH
jgi:hypothetical protein